MWGQKKIHIEETVSTFTGNVPFVSDISIERDKKFKTIHLMIPDEFVNTNDYDTQKAPILDGLIYEWVEDAMKQLGLYTKYECLTYDYEDITHVDKVYIFQEEKESYTMKEVDDARVYLISVTIESKQTLTEKRIMKWREKTLKPLEKIHKRVDQKTRKRIKKWRKSLKETECMLIKAAEEIKKGKQLTMKEFIL